MFFITVCTLLIGYWIYRSILNYFSPLRHIPEPRRYWLLKHLPHFLKAKDELDLHSNWAEQFKEYGMYKLETFAMPTKGLVVLLQSEYMKEVLSKPDIFPKTNVLNLFFPLFGNGLATATGESHRFQRKFFTKPFSMVHMKHYVPLFNKHAGILTEVWEQLFRAEKAGKNVLVKDYLMKLGLDIIGEISFGHNFDSQRLKLDEYGAAILRNSHGVLSVSQRALLLSFPFLWYLPFGPAQEAKKANQKCNVFLDKVIGDRVKLMKEGSLTDMQKNDWLTIMLGEKEGYFSHQQIKDSSFTFLVAGHETSAIGLTGVLLHLAEHPYLQEKVRQEINNKITDIKTLSIDELNNLSYTDAFIKESLRLFIPAPFTPRVVKKDHKIGNYVIPKGTGILIARHVLHESNEFEKGKDFLPDRWLSDKMKRGTFSTFGYGPRGCIGKHFTSLEMKVTIVRLLNKFRFTIDPGFNMFYRRAEMLLNVTPDIEIRVHPLDVETAE